MEIVCLDSDIIIWGVKRESSESQTEMIPKAEHLIKECESLNIKMIIPSIVVGEILSGTDQSLHNDVNTVLRKRFMILPYDTKAAIHYARMWQARAEQDLTPEVVGTTRDKMKADYMIIATAVANKAGCIYSNDPHIHRFAEGFIEVRDLSNVEVPLEQQSLEFNGDGGQVEAIEI